MPRTLIKDLEAWLTNPDGRRDQTAEIMMNSLRVDILYSDVRPPCREEC